MGKLAEIIAVLQNLFITPFNVDNLAEDYASAIRKMTELNGLNLNIGYINFSDDVLKNIITLSRRVVLPVGYVILAYLMVIEIYNLFSKAEGIGGSGVIQMPLKIIIKTVIFKFIIDRSHDLLEAIFRLILFLQNQIFSYSTSHTISAEAIQAFKAEVEAMGFLEKVLVFIKINTFSSIATIAAGLVMIVVIARIFETYIYLFVAPVPLSTLPGHELSQIGKSFLKSFTAICLQGVIIAIILFLYTQFAKTFVTGSTLNIQFAKSLTAIAILTFCLFRSGRWAKTICGSM